MHRVQTNAELAAIHHAGAGFVFNDFTSGPAGARDNVLHLASCPWVGRMLLRVEPHRQPSVRKIFFATFEEARSWLTSNRGEERLGWKPCDSCRPDGAGDAGRLRQAGSPSPATRKTDNAPPLSPQHIAEPASAAWPWHATFTMPSSQPLPLPVEPRLASWNKTGDPDQVRLAEYLAIADSLLRPRYAALTGPIALRLDVGLPSQAALLDNRDLDNYLYPLAARTGKNAAGALACVWGTKQQAATSHVRVEQAVPAAGASTFDCCYLVRTTASSQSTQFKEQIRDQLGAAAPLPTGPVRLQLSFTVGPGRNWLNLWKQTIDALGTILGHAPGAGPWAPLDGRIVDLGLHCRTDRALGHDVLIAIAAQHLRA